MFEGRFLLQIAPLFIPAQAGIQCDLSSKLCPVGLNAKMLLQQVRRCDDFV